jgi:hypothetical protein
MKATPVGWLLLSAVLIGTAVWGEDLTITTAPPVVVHTIPQAGATEIDPTLTALQVTFSKDMRDGHWTWWKLSDATFPPLAGQPQFTDKRTCILPVKLEPGKTYVVWINTEQTANFKDTDGRPAVPYLLVFQTKR